MIAALLKEMEIANTYLEKEAVDTIYIGGGTPSLLNLEELRLLIHKAQASFTISNNPEITLETNPDDITDQKLLQWKEAGINRLSIGVQSFFDEDLQWMNRAHNARQAIDAVNWAIKEFGNISIDLIYGTPQLSNERWKQNVERVISMNIPHLSCYALTVEPKTPLDKLIRQHRSGNVDPKKQSTQFLLLMQWLEDAGYEHYEISNFAKPGWRSRHNSAYWQAKKYIGIGPSAHSFNGTSRQWNVANNQRYMEAIRKNNIPFEKEELTPVQQLNEYIMIALRTMEGISLEIVQSDFSINKNHFLEKAGKFISNGLLQKEKNFIFLTKQGKLLADGIAADLFF